jgi:signal transduction histidine kinase
MIAYIIIFTGIINLILGIVVIFGSRTKKGKIPFALFAISTFIWSLADFFVYKTGQAFYDKLAYSTAALIPIFLLFWVFSLLDQKKKLVKDILTGLVGSIFIISPLINNLVIINIKPDPITGTTEQAGPLFIPFMAFFELAYLFVLIKLVRHFLKSYGEEKKRYRTILTGFLLYGAGSIMFGLVLPALGYERFTNFDVSCSLIFVGFTTYAILQYRWMNIKVVAFELLSIFIIGASLMEIFTSDTIGQRIYKSIMFVVLTLLSIFMVKSVLSEVKRKEELEVISKKLSAANEKLEELDKSRAEFMSFASHQLQTPLTAIRGYASLLLEGSGGELTATQNDMIGKISVSSVRTIQLVDDYLNISRIESGKLQFTFSDWHLEDICQEVISTLALKANEKKLSLTFNKPNVPLPIVNIDGPKVREVISNLVDNAIKYTPSGGVTVDIAQQKADDSDCIRVTVSDTGLGISKEEMPYLFAKFSRGNNKERLKIKGTGLGLYVGKVMIENNGGKIWAESEGEGKGSKFSIDIPIHDDKILKNAH